MRTIAILVCLAAPMAYAQEFRPGDETFSKPDLEARLSGQVIEFFDDSQAFYEADGRYRYTYRPEDPPFVGTWEANDASAICVSFDNGFARCDTYVVSRGRLTMIVDNGDRYPVRSEQPIR